MLQELGTDELQPSQQACASLVDNKFCLLVHVQQNASPLQVLGTDELYNYLSKYGIELDPQLENLVGRHARRPWSKFTNAENAHLVTPEGMDFLDKLLKYDHQVRYACKAPCWQRLMCTKHFNACWLHRTALLCHQHSCLTRAHMSILLPGFLPQIQLLS